MLNKKDKELIDSQITCARFINNYNIIIYSVNNYLDIENYLIRKISKKEIRQHNKSSLERRIVLKNGSEFLIKNSENSNVLRGSHPKSFLIDKSNYVEEILGLINPLSILILLDCDEPDYLRCAYCLCKTCQIAYENGGAGGCGDCRKCVTNGQTPIQQCKWYYNYTENIYKRDKGE